MGNRLIIKPVSRNLLDIFHGEQDWDQWTRIRVERRKDDIILHPQKGAHLSQPDAQEVMGYVSRNK